MQWESFECKQKNFLLHILSHTYFTIPQTLKTHSFTKYILTQRIIKITNKPIQEKNFSITKINILINPKQQTHISQLIISSSKLIMRSQSLNHFQAKQSCPATMNNSNQVSFQGPSRKFSMAELNQRIDIDQVMVDIKLTPLKSNQFHDKIKTVYSCLEWLKRLSPTLLEQVRTAELIIESIEAKWKKQQQQTKRKSQPEIQSTQQSYNQHPHHKQSNHKQSNHKRQQSTVINSKRKPMNPNILNSNIQNDVSPIKQLDQATSRIVYTNFSIKDIENSCKKEYSHKKSTESNVEHNNQSLNKMTNSKQVQSSKDITQSGRDHMKVNSSSRPVNMHKRQNSIVPVSIFDADDQEMEKLTKNIRALDKVLQRKGLGLRNDGLNRDYQQNYGQKSVNKTALKEVTLNSAKHSLNIHSAKKQLVFGGSKQRSSSANKENLFH